MKLFSDVLFYLNKLVKQQKVEEKVNQFSETCLANGFIVHLNSCPVVFVNAVVLVSLVIFEGIGMFETLLLVVSWNFVVDFIVAFVGKIVSIDGFVGMFTDEELSTEVLCMVWTASFNDHTITWLRIYILWTWPI